ncbi:MAG: SRPBCC family protein [bacterium]
MGGVPMRYLPGTMKKALTFFIAFILILVVVFFSGGLFLSKTARVERSRIIAAPPFILQATLEDLSTWPEWSAWSNERDPEAKWTFEGDPGLGMKWSWDSEGPLKQGSLTVLASSEDELRFQLVFIDGEQSMEAKDSIRLVPTPEGTKVTWSLDLEFDELMPRWMVAIGAFDAMLGGDYEIGLEGLAKRLETAAESSSGTDQEQEPAAGG